MWQKCAKSWTFSKVMAYLAKSWLDLTHSLLTHSVLKRILEERFNFLTFPADFYIPIILSNLNYDCSNFLDLRNLQNKLKNILCACFFTRFKVQSYKNQGITDKYRGVNTKRLLQKGISPIVPSACHPTQNTIRPLFIKWPFLNPPLRFTYQRRWKLEKILGNTINKISLFIPVFLFFSN